MSIQVKDLLKSWISEIPTSDTPVHPQITVTMAAAGETVNRVDIGIFKALPWIKSYNQRK